MLTQNLTTRYASLLIIENLVQNYVKDSILWVLPPFTRDSKTNPFFRLMVKYLPSHYSFPKFLMIFLLTSTFPEISYPNWTSSLVKIFMVANRTHNNFENSWQISSFFTWNMLGCASSSSSILRMTLFGTLLAYSLILLIFAMRMFPKVWVLSRNYTFYLIA